MATPVRFDLDRLETIRLRREFPTYTDMARQLGIDPVTLTQVRNGTRGVSALIISRMFTELGIPFNPGEPDSVYLFTEDEEKFQDSIL